MTTVMFEGGQELASALREYLAREAPVELVREWDRTGHFPADFYRGLAAQGYVGLPLSEAYDGMGAGATEMVTVGEELGHRGIDLAAGYGITTFCAMSIGRHGSDEQRRRHLPRCVTGEERYAIAMTEPDAGSDAAAIRTTALWRGGRYRIRGQKVFCTGAGQPGTILLVTVLTDPEAPRHKGMSVMIVPADAPGVEIRRMETVGRHIVGTYEVFFDNVEAGEDQILGPVNGGWEVLQSGLELERLFASATYVGAGRAVLTMIVSYVNERKQFGRSLGRFQAVSHPIADMHCDIEAAALLTRRAAQLLDAGQPSFLATSTAKLFGSEAVQRATNTGMQMMGGYGYMMEYDMQRFWRDARIVTVTAGTSQIQRTIIARELGVGSG